MCTAITMPAITGDILFCRTMDFSYPLDPELYLVPRRYQWTNLSRTHQFQNPYCFMGIGQDIHPVTFADGVNEMGFAAAALYFPGYADYDADNTNGAEESAASSQSGKVPIAAIELLRLLLGFCGSVDQAAPLLEQIRIVGMEDSITNTAAPLHWLIADASGKCAVIEKTADGMHLLDNPIGVLSNSPDLLWHITNLNNYMNLSPKQNTQVQWGEQFLKPFGQGAGTFGLPGDATPPSRFIRAAYYKSHSAPANSLEASIMNCFHILETVSLPKGSVITSRNTYDYTQYTACINLATKEYFFRTYDNSDIISIQLPEKYTQASQIISMGRLNQPIAFHPLPIQNNGLFK